MTGSIQVTVPEAGILPPLYIDDRSMPVESIALFPGPPKAQSIKIEGGGPMTAPSAFSDPMPSEHRGLILSGHGGPRNHRSVRDKRALRTSVDETVVEKKARQHAFELAFERSPGCDALTAPHTGDSMYRVDVVTGSRAAGDTVNAHFHEGNRTRLLKRSSKGPGRQEGSTPEAPGHGHGGTISPSRGLATGQKRSSDNPLPAAYSSVQGPLLTARRSIRTSDVVATDKATVTASLMTMLSIRSIAHSSGSSTSDHGSVRPSGESRPDASSTPASVHPSGRGLGPAEVQVVLESQCQSPTGGQAGGPRGPVSGLARMNTGSLSHKGKASLMSNNIPVRQGRKGLLARCFGI